MVSLVDDEDFDYLSQWKWHAKRGKTTFYAATNGRKGDDFQYMRMHRLIMSPPISMQVDHRDRDGLNNQKSNLRICNNGENKQNSLGWRKSTSVFKGVSANGLRWAAQLQKGEKNIWLGRFSNEIDAAVAYDFMAKKVFGEFARTNF